MIVFAALLAALFVIFAVAQGIGSAGVPAGDAAVVRSLPSGDGAVTEAELKRAIGQQIAAASSESKEKAPKPGSKKYEEVQAAALGELLDQIWIRGEADELGITATPKQIESELATIKKQNFPTPKAYEEFLDKSHFTQKDVDDRVKLQILSTEIQQKVSGEAPQPTPAEIGDYYDSERATQFTTPASRDIRVVFNERKPEVEAALKAVEAGGQSEKAWDEAAKKYSSSPPTGKGALQEGITEEFVKGALKEAIFEEPIGTLSGVVSYEKNFFLIEPVKSTPKKAKPLKEVRSQISKTLSERKQQEFFSEFVTEYQTKWSSRTTCASAFTVKERCGNYKSDGRIEGYEACYEADPKAPARECPAPVPMSTPALPGSVTEAEPKGKRLVQRPRPEAAPAAAGKGVNELGGAAPETGAPESAAPESAAPEEAPPSGE